MTLSEGAQDRILSYGTHEEQRIELSYPSGTPRGTVVVIHGGYWRSPFTADLMHPLVPQFTSRGWLVANLEYRRGEHGWRALSEDLAAGLATARSVTTSSRLAIVGHSVGGQLALLGGSEGDAIVALAPVTDLVRGYHEGIGDGAVAEFFVDSPEAAPELYASASPLLNVSPRATTLVVHGCDDARVPIEHTRDYIGAAGSEVSLLELPQLSHLHAIEPDAPHWVDVHAWLDRWLATD